MCIALLLQVWYGNIQEQEETQNKEGKCMMERGKLEVLVEDRREMWEGKCNGEDVVHVQWNHLPPRDDSSDLDWAPRETGGLLAVRLEKDHLGVRVLAGSHPHIQVLIPLLDACHPGWQDRAAELHGQRVRPWTVHKRTGMSGCETYTLRSLGDDKWADSPVEARLHISMAGKFGGIHNMWLGDLLPILAEVVKSEYMRVEGGSAAVWLEVNLPWYHRHSAKWVMDADATELMDAISEWRQVEVDNHV